MKKEVFLERLEALLQDIPEEEKRDAIDYYRDYLEEAGPEKEEEVLAEFQSPEHIAEVIRTELQSEWRGSGEFTDRGYSDSRFEEKRTTLSRSGGAEQGEREKEAGFQAGTEDDPFREFRDEETGENAASNESQRSRLGEMLHCLKEKITGSKMGMVVAVLVVLAVLPFIFSLVTRTVGGVFGLAVSLAAILVVLGLMTVLVFVGGIALFVLGVANLFEHFAMGLMFIGLGIAAEGSCLLLICGCILFYGVFLPWAVKGIIRLCRQAAGYLSARA